MHRLLSLPENSMDDDEERQQMVGEGKVILQSSLKLKDVPSHCCSACMCLWQCLAGFAAVGCGICCGGG